VMTCSMSPSGTHVLSGGLDNVVSVHALPAASTPGTGGHKVQAELAQHGGYVSCGRWINDREILSSSGDQTVIHWDVETKSARTVYSGHLGDVMSVRMAPGSSHTFVSTSTDATAKLWDMRLPVSGAGRTACVQTFMGHESDVNTASWLSDGFAFATGSDDSTCRLWDIRAQSQLNSYVNDRILCGITSCSFSGSGRMLFASYEDHSVHIWDTQLGVLADSLMGHDDRVSALGVSPDGKALFTASWDTYIKIWA